MTTTDHPNLIRLRRAAEAWRRRAEEAEAVVEWIADGGPTAEALRAAADEVRELRRLLRVREESADALAAERDALRAERDALRAERDAAALLYAAPGRGRGQDRRAT